MTRRRPTTSPVAASARWTTATTSPSMSWPPLPEAGRSSSTSASSAASSSVASGSPPATAASSACSANRWSRRSPTGARSSSTAPSRRWRTGRIYVVRTDDGLVVKRAGRDGADGWRLVSDNPDKQAWPTLHWPVDALVIGEVRWVGRPSRDEQARGIPITGETSRTPITPPPQRQAPGTRGCSLGRAGELSTVGFGGLVGSRREYGVKRGGRDWNAMDQTRIMHDLRQISGGRHNSDRPERRCGRRRSRVRGGAAGREACGYGVVSRVPLPTSIPLSEWRILADRTEQIGARQDQGMGSNQRLFSHLWTIQDWSGPIWLSLYGGQGYSH